MVNPRRRRYFRPDHCFRRHSLLRYLERPVLRRERNRWPDSLVVVRWRGADATTLAINNNYFLLPTNSLPDDIEWGSSPILFRASDGRTLVAASGKAGVLYTLNAADLSLAWQTTLAVKCICPECGCGSISTPATDGKLLYSGTGVSNPELFDEGTTYAISPDDGRIVWQKTTPGVVLAPVAVAAGMVFVSTTKGLEIRDASTGDLLWDDQQRGVLYGQCVVQDGTVYRGYFNGRVTAWRLDDDQRITPPTESQPRREIGISPIHRSSR